VSICWLVVASAVSFYTIPNAALGRLRKAALPEVVTERGLFSRRVYQEDGLETFLEAEAARQRPFPGPAVLFTSLEFLLADRGVELSALVDQPLSEAITGPGRSAYAFGWTERCTLLERWPTFPDDADASTIWAAMRAHGFPESQRAYADTLAAALTTVRNWLEAVTGDETGLLLVEYR
jgi:hypothetical protein